MKAVLAYNTADNGAVSFNFDPQGKISSVSAVRQEVAWQAELEK